MMMMCGWAQVVGSYCTSCQLDSCLHQPVRHFLPSIYCFSCGHSRTIKSGECVCFSDWELKRQLTTCAESLVYSKPSRGCEPNVITVFSLLFFAQNIAGTAVMTTFRLELDKTFIQTEHKFCWQMIFQKKGDNNNSHISANSLTFWTFIFIIIMFCLSLVSIIKQLWYLQ